VLPPVSLDFDQLPGYGRCSPHHPSYGIQGPVRGATTDPERRTPMDTGCRWSGGHEGIKPEPIAEAVDSCSLNQDGFRRVAVKLTPW
jgi:hypothetical protein